MSGGPLVSVIVTCYNGESWISGALESALGQTYRDIEVIVVNDGSSDGSAAVISRFVADKRLKIAEQENKGVAAARNKGLSLASGELVCVLDQDDLWLPGHVAAQVEFLAQDELGAAKNDGQVFGLAAGHQRVDRDRANGCNLQRGRNAADDFIGIAARAFEHPLQSLFGRSNDRKAVRPVFLEEELELVYLVRHTILPAHASGVAGSYSCSPDALTTLAHFAISDFR